MNKNLNITKKFIAKILSFFASLLFTKDLRHKYKTKILKLLMTPEPEELKQWQIMSNKETLQFINDTKCSIARFGDGEIGYMLDNKFKHFFQPYNKELQEKLRYIYYKILLIIV